MSVRRIQLVRRAAGLGTHASRQRVQFRVVRRRAHFRRAERYDRFVGGEKRSRKVAIASALVL
jgi:hypothetical protein